MSSLRRRTRWWRASDLVTVLGVVLIDAFGVGLVIASDLFSTGALVAIVTVAGLTTYVALTRLVNATVLTVTPERVVTRHGPLPWFGGQTLSVDAIDGIFAASKPLRWDAGGLSAYAVVAETPEGPVEIYQRRDVDDTYVAELAGEIRAILNLSERLEGADTRSRSSAAEEIK